jgi:energy-coupling factor transport system permease protein
MAQGLYLPGDGFFHRLSPPFKVTALFLGFVPPLLFNHPAYMAGVLAFWFALAVASGSWPNVRRLAGLAAILFLMSAILWPLFKAGGPVLVAVGPVRVTEIGLLYGVAAGLRLVAFLLAALVLLSTTTVEEFTRGLVRLGIPYRAAFALSLAFRLVPLFLESGRTIAAAQMARGLDLESGGPVARGRRHIPVLVPILLTAIRRADSMSIALEARGFGAGKRRTSLSDRPATWRDAVAVGGAFLLLAASAALRRLGYGVLG